MSKELKIGIVTLVTGFFLYYGFNYLGGSDIFSSTNRYYVIYPNISGLTVSNSVNFMGTSVGRVSSISLQQRKRRIVVALDIDQTLEIGKNATATLANADLFGSKAIILDVGNLDETLEPGDTLRAIVGEDMLAQLDPVVENVNTTISSLNLVLEKLNTTDLKGTVDELQKTIVITKKIIEMLGPQLNDAVIEYTKVANTLNNQAKSFDPIIMKANLLMDSLNAIKLNQTVDNLNHVLIGTDEVLKALVSEQGTVGKLLTNDSTYFSLLQLLANLDSLAVHFNKYPRDFLKPLGRKHSQLKGVNKARNKIRRNNNENYDKRGIAY